MSISVQTYKAIKEIVDERMKEIKVTREDFDGLKRVVKELAEAQRRTEIRLEKLIGVVDQINLKMSEEVGISLEEIGSTF